MVDPRSIWEQRYERVLRGEGMAPREEHWLGRWRERFVPGTRVLDLGCGAGHDSRWLAAAGCRVIAGDYARNALAAARMNGMPAPLLQLDLRDGLPFAPRTFDAVVANLCLHYFPWAQTVEILAQVRACLVEGGTLLARFNSTQDTNFGAQGDTPIEHNAYLVDGMYKRYFDRADLERLFGESWRVLSMEELTVHRFRSPKVLWEVCAV